MVIFYILHILCLLIVIAFYTLSERKIIASIQRRQGPHIVGVWGLLQPLADGLKVLFKQFLVPRNASVYIFILAPIYVLSISLIVWAFIPFSPLPLVYTSTTQVDFLGLQSGSIIDTEVSLLLLVAISSLSIYGIIFSGWSSNSKYALLGALRSASQLISYEVVLTLLLVPILMYAETANFAEIIESQNTHWFIFTLWPVAIPFFISSLAETNRIPFDLPEAEAELVAGYNIDYSALPFALFFLSEYSNMLIMSALNAGLFWGGWYLPFHLNMPLTSWIYSSIFSFKIVLFSIVFVWVRAILPRYRYDQLMYIYWKVILPFVVLLLIVITSTF